jgi:Transcriptional regulator
LEQKTSDNNGKDAVKILDKSICLLKKIATDQTQKKTSITGLSKELGVSRSTMYRILDTLLAHRILMKDEASGQYSLGWNLCFLGNAAQRSNSLYMVLHPILVKLSDEFEETVSISVLDEGEGLVIDTIRGSLNNPLVVDVYLGVHEPLHTTAYGKALLLDHSEAELAETLGGQSLPVHASGTLRTVSALHDQIQTARKLGYTIAVDEFDEGVSALACPVRDFSRSLVAAVSLATPTVRMTPDNIARFSGKLISIAREMSEALGF